MHHKGPEAAGEAEHLSQGRVWRRSPALWHKFKQILNFFLRLEPEPPVSPADRWRHRGPAGCCCRCVTLALAVSWAVTLV